MAPSPIDHENPPMFKNSPSQRYERLDLINCGAYGVVFKARDKETGEIVALKMWPELSHALAEINIYKTLTSHPSIVDFKGVETDRRARVYVVMEYVENDLNTLLYEKRRRNSFTKRDIKHMMKQLLEGVVFIHDKGVMHRDLKPSNILIDDKEKLKICDFGLSVQFGGTTRGTIDPHVGTLWYKAPELLLERQTHSSPVDMWAVGCIMAELLLSEPLFQGKSDAHQLSLIRETIGGASRKRLRVKLGSKSGLDLLERLLAYDPDTRITAKDALNHRFFKEDSFGDLFAWCTNKLKICTR